MCRGRDAVIGAALKAENSRLLRTEQTQVPGNPRKSLLDQKSYGLKIRKEKMAITLKWKENS